MSFSLRLILEISIRLISRALKHFPNSYIFLPAPLYFAYARIAFTQSTPHLCLADWSATNLPTIIFSEHHCRFIFHISCLMSHVSCLPSHVSRSLLPSLNQAQSTASRHSNNQSNFQNDYKKWDLCYCK